MSPASLGSRLVLSRRQSALVGSTLACREFRFGCPPSRRQAASGFYVGADRAVSNLLLLRGVVKPKEK